MFTEGLDQKAINWIKEGSDVVAQTPRSPLIEKFPMNLTSNLPLLHESCKFLSPKGLPPVKFHSGLLSPKIIPPLRYQSGYIDSDDDSESVGSAPEGFYAHFSDTFEDENSESIDSDLFVKSKNKNYDEEVQSTHQRPLTRGLSKENLRVDVAVNVTHTINKYAGSCFNGVSHSDASVCNQEQNGLASPQGHIYHEFMTPSFQDLDTPSAPPIGGIGREGSELDGESMTNHAKVFHESIEVSSDVDIQSQKTNEPPPRIIIGVGDKQVPSRQNYLADHVPCYTTSVQSAWQTFIAYDACFRLCLDAWERNCMEAPEFLKDQCMLLRNAFGIQKYLLQPQGHIQISGRPVDNSEGTCSTKGRKGIGQIEVEVKRVRIIPRRRRLRASSSQREIYMQVGAEYVRQVTTIVKSRINSLKSTSSPVAPKEALSCSLQLKSATEVIDSCSPIYFKPGCGDSHVFYPENQADALLVEVLDINKSNQGHATIHFSSLDFSQGEIVRWWPLYLEDNGCVGKVQLCISASSTSEKLNSSKGGPVVETLIYDLVLEAAMRAQLFHPKNLHMNGMWKWLLDEFAKYYGVSEAYTKLRYISNIMNIATPTRECLELLYELLLPVVKARGEKRLTRQERSILLECEDQIKSLLANTFQNYKSLDENSLTGLTDAFSPIPESAAPAMVPAVQIFSLLHDILSHESQNLLRNYFLVAAANRCKRYMLETEEFISSNSDGFLVDPMAISTAYLKMRILCVNISHEIQADIKIHNQHVLPSSIDLPNIAASMYSPELCKRLRSFLASCPPSKPSPHVTDLLIATADFERDLDLWHISPVCGGVISKDLFNDYIMVWIQDTRLQLLDICKAEKVPPCGIMTHSATSPFVENVYDQIKDRLYEYEVVINRWPQYLLNLESAVADVEKAIVKALEKQYNDILVPLQDGIPKLIEKQMQKFTRRQSCTSFYIVPSHLGTFLNTVKRILDVLHIRVENILKSWSSYITIADTNPVFGEQMNAVTVMLKKKYKKHMESIIGKLVSNMQANRSTRLKRILEETKEAEGEVEIRERMQALCAQLIDCIRNLQNVFSSRIFVAICRGFWDRMGLIVLTFLVSIKENRIWYRGSDYALGILDDLFASEMQSLLGSSLQDRDLDPPQSVVEARSILC